MAISNASLPPSTENDSELLERVTNCLDRQNSGARRTLRIDVQDGIVVVQGRVPSFHLRQVAIECIKHVPGVLQLNDHIEVVDRFESHSGRAAKP